MRKARRVLWIVPLLIAALPPVLQGADETSRKARQAGDEAHPPAPLHNVTANLTDDNLIVKGNACIGGLCTDTDDDLPVLKLKDVSANILFDTVEIPGELGLSSSAARNWALRANPGGLDQFSLMGIDTDTDTNTTPLSVAGGAPDNSLFVGSGGNNGLGTAEPSAPLHVSRATGSILEGILLSNDNEARIAIQNTNLSVKYFLAVNNFATGEFFISRDGGGGPIVEVNRRLDGGGAPSLKVTGSVQATNVTFTSSRDLKRDFQAVDPQEVLARMAALPISRWRFKDGPDDEHIGPVAEDFHAAFDLGSSDKTISLTDASGVALAAVKGLLQQIQELQEKNAELSRRLEALEQRESRE
jgi:Chaperone of endosialidase